MTVERPVHLAPARWCCGWQEGGGAAGPLGTLASSPARWKKGDLRGGGFSRRKPA
jgi:hypothetical protein